MSQPASHYELSTPLDGTSWAVRENLVDIVERELVGPESDTELLDVPPDARYVLGRIAPTKLDDDITTAASSADDPDTLFGDELAAMESSGVPLSDVDETAPDGDEDAGGDRDDEPVRRGLMIPASMGLRFQVPKDLEAFTVHCSWGVYRPEKSEELSGNETRYRRTPVEMPVQIPVATLTPGVTADYPLVNHVHLRVDTYPDPVLDRLLVEVALCNDQVTPRRIPTDAWLFQTKLHIDAGGAAAFEPVRDVMDPRTSLGSGDDEQQRLDLRYRDRLEFAIGRTCSADWTQQPGTRRATSVRTTWLPSAETPQTLAANVPGALLDMRALSTAEPSTLDAGLRPIVDAYGTWLDAQDAQAAALPEHLRQTAADTVNEARQVHRQLSDGLDFLLHDPEALRCFGFMNRVMADQRVHSQIVEKRAKDASLTLRQAETQVLDGGFPHHWRVFQLAFVLMQLRALSDPTLLRRSGKASLAKVELLFFPTGGGKTEAYLGLAAYAFAIRRRQGVIDTPDGPLDGNAGVTVLMRYTLRLLTSQQFQRATALVCAAELARQEDPGTWGSEPFRIGLWVGTGVSPKRVAEAAKELQQLRERRAEAGYRFAALQLGRCPWCGRPVSHADVEVQETPGRVYVYCSDDRATCPFSRGGLVDEGIPVLTTDEEIYRLVPCFVIATVDKFARLARESQAASLFGYVGRRCDRHGFVPHLDSERHSDYSSCEIQRHSAKSGHPAAGVRPTGRLRPPDLIIQDELHLITGALGTTVGLFEVAIDVMTQWQTADGTAVKPLVVASSATVRKAADQVHDLYGRGLTVFPPQVLDASDTFFSRDADPAEAPGRRYLGISTTGVKLTTTEIQVAVTLMAGAQLLLDRAGGAADPYLTLVGYFSATRELAGMARYTQDDVQTALVKRRPGSHLPARFGTDFGSINLGELTSRISAGDIAKTLDQLAVVFDAGTDSTQARQAAREARQRGETVPRRDINPFDVVLATSMLQVGVDVPRLGLMMVVGQPKNTAEYIQASSRVGRADGKPGLVVTIGNWARPRDLAHYEQFRHFHETFYARVEPLSVTPFSVTSLERGLDGVLVAAARVLHAAESVGLSPEKDAWRVGEQRPFLERLIDALVARTAGASPDETATRFARERLANRHDRWEQWNEHMTRRGLRLAYERFKDTSRYAALICSAESATGDTTDAPPFRVANSMREVQPEVNLLVSPVPARLVYDDPPGAPQWQVQPQPQSTGGDS
ncbi:MAG: DISARM system helicase DrmA [Micrococcales bacterium]|nr:DISARM system helicase DrmA [Micrococcales bacterium]MCL2668708.1 DISARM system helicase DrmA [Micrococcales bacterium]